MWRGSARKWSWRVFKSPKITGSLAKKVSVTDYGKRAAMATFPFTYPSWNDIQGMHWAKRKREHDAFINAAGTILKSLYIEPFKKPVSIFIDLYFKKKRVRDNDNYGGKWLIDAIRMVGIIPDDSARWIPTSPDILIIDGEGVDQTMLKIKEN